MQQGVFLGSFQPRGPRTGGLSCLDLAVSARVSQSPADAGDHQEHEQEEYDDVEDGPVTVGFGHSPVEKHVGHPEGVANTGARLRVAGSMPGTVVLAQYRANLAD